MVLPSLQNAHRRRFTSRKHTSPAHINHHTLVLFSLPGSQKKRVKSATGERETTSRETNFRLKLTLSAGEIQCEPKLTSVEIFSFPFFRLQEREMGGGSERESIVYSVAYQSGRRVNGASGVARVSGPVPGRISLRGRSAPFDRKAAGARADLAGLCWPEGSARCAPARRGVWLAGAAN